MHTRALKNIFTFFLFMVSAGWMFGLPIEARAATMSPEKVIALVNAARKQAGLEPVVSNTLLADAAKAKAQDMIENDYFAHTSPKGVSPWYWMKKVGYGYKYAGENLAINYTNAEEQQKAWMNSPTHRANILNTHYAEIGVAIVKGKINGETSLITVEMFGTPLQAVAADVIVPPRIPLTEAQQVKGTESTENTFRALVPVVQPIPVSLTREEEIIAVVVSILLFTFFAPSILFILRSAWLLLKTAFESKEEEMLAEQSLLATILLIAKKDGGEFENVFLERSG